MNCPLGSSMKSRTNSDDCRIIVFAKAPIPGQVKTRLIPSLGASGAACLYQQLLLRTLSTVTDARAGVVELWCAPSAEHAFFLECAERFEISLCSQREGDLGERMGHAFEQTLKKTPLALLIGADCLSLRGEEVRQARSILAQGADAVIGPSEDGGYFLIGLRRLAPELFTSIAWGTGSVLAETRSRLQSLGWRWHELSEGWDVDRPEDVERMKDEIEILIEK